MPATSAAAVTAELRKRLPGIGRLKLQKLLYYCQGHHLETYDEPLFGEVIKAYQMGPVVPQIRKAEELGIEVRDDAAHLSESALGTIGFVVDNYGHLHGNALADRTHAEAPWKDAWERHQSGGSDVIERSAIQTYFRGLTSPIRPETRAWLNAAGARRALPGRPDDLERLRRLRAGG
jgi:uncharacterized phage-associated protein